MYEYNAKLTKIVDGDTIDVEIDLGFSIWHKARVRMVGINAPETRTRDLEEKKLGLKAKARLKELLSKEIILKTQLDKKGKFGRVLGEIFVNKTNINKQLLKEGVVRKYD
tara:strand:+ start:15504 stop:15833 length:330 start_codon:yes stop_codon:yes gene_type:complete